MPLLLAERYACKICGEEFSGRGMRKHLSGSHPKISVEVYYRKHIMKKGEGLCANAECRKPVPFSSLTGGFRKVCGTSCQMKARFQDQKFLEYWSEKKSKDMRKVWDEDDGTKAAIVGKNLSDGLKRLHNDSEWERKNKKIRTAGAREKWKDPSYREKMSKTSSRTLKARWQNDAGWVEQMRQIAKETIKHAIAAYDPVKTREGGRRGAEIRWSKPGEREKASAKASSRLRDPEDSFGRVPTAKYRGILMRSSWEIKFARFLDSLSCTWSYEPKTFTVRSGKRYTPDFHIKKLKLYVEVKPDKFKSQHQWKLDDVRALGHKIVFCTEKNQRNLRKAIRKRLEELE